MQSRTRPAHTREIIPQRRIRYNRFERFVHSAVLWLAITATILGVLLIPDHTVIGVALAIVGCIVVKAAGRAS
jgi:hypothetical protein